MPLTPRTHLNNFVPLVVGCLALLSSLQAEAVPFEKFIYYGQNSVESRTQNFVTLHRIRADVFDYQLLDWRASIYVGGHAEQDTRSNQLERFNDNFVAPAAGFALTSTRFGIGLLSEAQYQWRAREVNAEREFEARGAGRFVLYHALFREMQLGLGPQVFIESYADAVHRTELEGNAFFLGIARGGPRWHFGSMWSVDLFPEIDFKRDIKGWAWENTTDLRIGGRVNMALEPWSASLHATFASGAFQGDRTYFSSAKALLAVGMEI